MARFGGSPSEVKRAQKQSFILREISQHLTKLSEDEPILATLSVTRVELSKGEGMCEVFFSSTEGAEGFERALEVLKLYGPALRRALAKARQGRHTPELLFSFDETVEKERHMQELLDRLRDEE